MNKFLFKSNLDSDLSKNIINKLDMLLTEQRKQRADLYTIDRKVHQIINSLNLQKQVDEYFEKDDDGEAHPGLPLEDSTKNIPEV